MSWLTPDEQTLPITSPIEDSSVPVLVVLQGYRP